MIKYNEHTLTKNFEYFGNTLYPLRTGGFCSNNGMSMFPSVISSMISSNTFASWVVFFASSGLYRRARFSRSTLFNEFGSKSAVKFVTRLLRGLNENISQWRIGWYNIFCYPYFLYSFNVFYIVFGLLF